jgi:hypothetical protein
MADLLTNLDFANTAAAVITQNTFKYVGWGTGTGQTAASTNLATPAAPTATTAVTGTMSNVTTTQTNDTVQVDGTVTAGGALAITEAGVFKSATMAGNMCAYSSFSAMNMGNGDSIAFTFKKKYA